jgi:hypothetical protein
MTKTKTPTRKPRKPIILSSWEWSQYHQQMIKYLEHQLRLGLERREQKIARLERQIARLQGK